MSSCHGDQQIKKSTKRCNICKPGIKNFSWKLITQIIIQAYHNIQIQLSFVMTQWLSAHALTSQEARPPDQQALAANAVHRILCLPTHCIRNSQGMSSHLGLVSMNVSRPCKTTVFSLVACYDSPPSQQVLMANWYFHRPHCFTWIRLNHYNQEEQDGFLWNYTRGFYLSGVWIHIAMFLVSCWL